MRLRYGAKRGPWLAAAAALFLPVAAYAQDDALPDPGVMRAIEAAIPPQSWYPDGYRDIRIAAEATLADRPHGGQPDTTTGFASFGSADLIVCDHDYSAADWGDPATTSLGRIAMDSARFRAKLRQLGYPENLYDAPLLDFEKARLEQEASPETPAPASDPRFALAAAINDNRLKLAPDLPPVSASRFCPIAAPGASFAFPIAGILGGGGGGGGSPGGPAAVVFATDPPAGQVLLTSAFAFNVCARKQPDPWDRLKCRWNEVETGIENRLSGRFVYQVRWPDGIVRRGIRDIRSPANVVTFKKAGS